MEPSRCSASIFMFHRGRVRVRRALKTAELVLDLVWGSTVVPGESASVGFAGECLRPALPRGFGSVAKVLSAYRGGD